MQNELKDKQCIGKDHELIACECIMNYHKHKRQECIISRINIIQLMY